jgi:hypothetical protein
VSVILVKKGILLMGQEVSGLVEPQIYTTNGVWKKLKAEMLFPLCYLFGQ